MDKQRKTMSVSKVCLRLSKGGLSGAKTAFPGDFVKNGGTQYVVLPDFWQCYKWVKNIFLGHEVRSYQGVRRELRF